MRVFWGAWVELELKKLPYIVVPARETLGNEGQADLQGQIGAWQISREGKIQEPCITGVPPVKTGNHL